jgi:CHAT domain-containing protein
MIKNYPCLWFLLSVFFLIRCALQAASPVSHSVFISDPEQEKGDYKLLKKNGSLTEEIKHLNRLLQTLLAKGNTGSCQTVIDSIIVKTRDDTTIDIKTLSESYYFIGVYYSIVKQYLESIEFLNLSVSVKGSDIDKDYRYAKTLYNLGIAFNGIGDFNRYEYYCLRALELEKVIFGESSPDLISTYSSLIIANIELQEYEKAISYANIALTIANNNPDRVSPLTLADLYNNMGSCWSRLADFSKAKIYLDKSESIYLSKKLDLNDNYINLMNSIAITYGSLGFVEKSVEYYEKGIALAESNSSALAYNMVFSYAILLAKTGKQHKGEALLITALGRAKAEFGEDSRSYIEILNNYADYLREYKIDLKKSIGFYEICMSYIRKNDRDLFLRDLICTGYSLSLTEAGYPYEALEILQQLLFSEDEAGKLPGPLVNPDIKTIKADKESLKILKTKYKILWEIFRKSADDKTLEAVSSTSELVVSLLERVRINISEEESRLILGDRYRDSYLNAIRDFNLLYSNTANRRFLEKAFEYLEKSKVAGLLASTRELKAVQLHIPQGIAEFEKRLQREISLFDAHITEQMVKEEPDSILINSWKERLLETTRKRDSLILKFEKQYPDYYAIKYNTNVVKLSDIPRIAGRNGNYISYVASDTILYIFVANRKYQQLQAVKVDSAFYDNIRKFRKLLSGPLASENARLDFENFKSIGYGLYKILIDPVRKYLISDKILISPDNILSYLPFETLLTSAASGERVSYSDIHYLLKDFDISYTYSATFMAESVRRDYFAGNKAIVFAPGYPEPIDIQQLLMNRQALTDKLTDLPYAKIEAEYVSNITRGMLFKNGEAKKSVFKSESGKYDIIHLAMHTVLNDKDPMYSTLIFSNVNDSINDRYLKTYEVYGIALKAKMVVLSSCNTGSGLLFSGEGILSLARGFAYSGSQSVVMSMWEIEDKSGTDIVKMFYRNLKNGNSKSKSLRKARIAFLKNSDQLRSHPYFWSTLVIYGNNAPLYYSRYLIISIFFVVVLITVSLTFYFRKRKYS